MKWIYYAVKLGNPHQFQFALCLWKLSTFEALIERELGIKPSKSSFSPFLGRLALSSRLPIYQLY